MNSIKRLKRTKLQTDETKVRENRILRAQKSNSMNVRKYIFAIGLTMVALYACNNDDDDAPGEVIPPRDRAEQQANEDPIIRKYLETHFFTLIDNPANPDYQIVQFDTIAGANSGEQALIDSDLLETKTITREDPETGEDVNYTLYVLNHRRGAATERQPMFSDSTLVTFRGEQFYENEDEDGDGIPDDADVDADGDNVADQIDGVTRTDKDSDGIADDSDADDDGVAGTDPGKVDSDGDGIIDDKDPVDNNDPNRRVFDSSVTPVWFDLVSIIEGFREAATDYRGASGSTITGDGSVDFNDDFGNLTVFIPSGLAYFDVPPLGTGIGTYKSLIFNIQLYAVNESDHDRDGIPSYLEDLDNDRLVLDSDDNTDNDASPNYLDTDDDGDGTQTRDEITVNDANEDGFISLDEITFYDDDGDGIQNHLDPDDRDSKND
ncbi:hypothetical protein [Aquimarina sp. AU474]|uniref:hypothetical protein n=1 Tax=Aquimarina sp. AU474 TaxID=2108529 RepID=UPI000D68F54D|nr:hypothetical protein [Aquimarina sp. AU474]